MKKAEDVVIAYNVRSMDVQRTPRTLSQSVATTRVLCTSFVCPLRLYYVLYVLTYISTHLLRSKEENVIFNDALNTFYLRLYGVRHLVKDHSDSESGNPLSPHGLLFPINSKCSFICIILHITVFATPLAGK